MEKLILQKLDDVERLHNVKILYACESGSRAWGFASTDSDYDVRFIYVSPLKDYLTAFEKRDVIEFETNEVFDVNGWDLRKALNLLYKYNPTLMEWLRSPIVYKQDRRFFDEYLKLSDSYYNGLTCKHHYYHMAKGNFERYLQDDVISLKRYLYVLRPLVAIDYINKYDSMPPTSFIQTLALVDLDHEVRESINQLLDIKMTSGELGTGSQIDSLTRYIRESLKKFVTSKSDRFDNETESLDKFLYQEVIRFNEKS